MARATLRDVHDSDLMEILRELSVQVDTLALEIDHKDQALLAEAVSLPLGNGGYLHAFWATRAAPQLLAVRRQNLEQGVRRLRDCFRKHDTPFWPHLRMPSDSPDPRRLILARIQQFLRGLVDTSALHQMVLTCGGRIIASALPLDPIDGDRLDLLSRQLRRSSEQTPGSDHGELAQSDVYACSFWYGAALFGFCKTAYSEDFVRHRSKQVAKELVHLLTMLEGEPDDPIKEAPNPA